MPRQPINYNETVFYKIVCNDLQITDMYIGHSTNFSKRKYNHKANCTNPKIKDYGIKLYQFIRENGGWEAWSMAMIEQRPCENKLDALRHERHLIETLKPTLNHTIPTRNLKEWYEANKDVRREYAVQYHIKTAEKRHLHGREDVVCTNCGQQIKRFSLWSQRTIQCADNSLK